MSVVAQGFDEPARLPQKLGVVVHEGHRVLHPLDFTEQFRVLLRHSQQGTPRLLLLLVDGLDGSGFDGLSAPDAQLLVAGSIPLASRALDGRDGVRLLVFDLDAVGRGDFPVVGLAEDRDVARSHVAAAFPPVMVLEMGLIDALTGEVAGAALPHVGERRALGRDAGFLRGLLEHLQLHLVGDVLGSIELTPEGRVRVVGSRMDVQPLPEVGYRGNQRNRPLALLAIDGDLQAVLVVGDVADGQASNLATPSAGVPRDGDERLVPREPGVVEHGLHLFVPVEHLAGVGHRVVVLRRGRGDPRDTVGLAVSLGDVFPEHSECDPVVPVGLLVVVAPVNPADDFLSGFAVLEGVGESADVLTHSNTMTKQLLAALVAVLTTEQDESVVKRQQGFLVRPTEFGSFLDALDESFGATVGVFGHLLPPMSSGHVNQRLNAGRRHFSELDSTRSFSEPWRICYYIIINILYKSYYSLSRTPRLPVYECYICDCI